MWGNKFMKVDDGWDSQTCALLISRETASVILDVISLWVSV
jgi:hypothetical protein